MKANSQIYFRLIALWVLCEAMLGGIIHGLRIPVSGLFVGSCAVICISLIGWYVPVRGAILKATIVVAVFKMMLSPQAPPPAYIAVFFQGCVGEILFRGRKLYKLSALLLGMITLLESGLQRIVVLTIIYGNDFWKAINEFLNSLTGQKEMSNYSLIIAGIYIGLHIIVGIFVGIWAGRLPAIIENWRNSHPELRMDANQSELKIGIEKNAKQKSRLKKSLFFIWAVLLFLYVQSYFKIGVPLLPSLISFKIFIRSLIIVLSWYLVIGPLLRRVLHGWLKKARARSATEIQSVLDLLPGISQLISRSWMLSKEKPGLKRVLFFSNIVLSNLVEEGNAKEIIIVTGPIGSGKTTALLQWTNKKNNISGVLTPVKSGIRVFRNIKTGEEFPMVADNLHNGETFMVGRFIFRKDSFEKAAQIIRSAIGTADQIIIDEVGPLELRAEGFSEVLKELIVGDTKQRIILVVREGLVDNVVAYFNLQNAIIKKGAHELI